MVEIPHINNPPSKEAVIDIRVGGTKLSLDELQAVLEGLKDGYEVQPIFSQTFEFAHGPEGVKANNTNEPKGFRLTNGDKTYISQINLDGFSLSRLAPYNYWDQFSAEARRLWDYCSQAYGDFEVERIGVRFVNQILIPFTNEQVDIDKYINGCPQTPDLLGQRVARFFSRIEVPVPEEKAGVDIILASQNPINEHLPVILDIDAYRQGLGVCSNDEIWEVLQSLRELKNKAFIATVTDDTMRLFD